MEEMAQAALDKGMYAIGFSSHSTMPFECGWTMRGAPIDVYLAEAARVRELFAGKLDVLAGLELDYHSDVPIDGLDSVAYTHLDVYKRQGGWLAFVRGRLGGDVAPVLRCLGQA